MTHEITVTPQCFTAILSGQRNFEIRENTVGFQRHDIVLIHDSAKRGATERVISKTIGYVTNWAQRPNFVVFSLLDDN